MTTPPPRLAGELAEGLCDVDDTKGAGTTAMPSPNVGIAYLQMLCGALHG
jgi:hypothetical protein